MITFSVSREGSVFGGFSSCQQFYHSDYDSMASGGYILYLIIHFRHLFTFQENDFSQHGNFDVFFIIFLSNDVGSPERSPSEPDFELLIGSDRIVATNRVSVPHRSDTSVSNLTPPRHTDVQF